MRYHYQVTSKEFEKHNDIQYYYSVDHPLYNMGTLIFRSTVGLVLIQQKRKQKFTYWDAVNPELMNDIYSHKDFDKLFETYAGVQSDGYFPTITVRHAMHWLKMKPLKKERWETCFDRTII